MTYLAFARVAVLRNLTYRAGYWMSLTGTGSMVAIQYCLWSAVYSAASPAPGGMTLAQTLTYVLTARAASAFLSLDAGRGINQRVRLGTIATELARPVDLQLALFFEGLGEAAFTLLAVSVPVFSLLALTGLVVVPPPATVLWFVASLLLAYLVMYALSFAVGLMGFWTGNGMGLTDFLEAGVVLFSGALVPLDFYPASLRSIAQVLPFQTIYHLPMSIFAGRTGSLPSSLALQAGWAVLLILAGRLAWHQARSVLMVQGG
ncbi:MAG: ABC-2 family transporter protein [Bacillota bacterium]